MSYSPSDRARLYAPDVAHLYLAARNLVADWEPTPAGEPQDAELPLFEEGAE